LAPKWAWTGVRDPISKFWDPLNISQTEKSYDLQIWHAHTSWVVLAPGPQIGPKLGVAWGRDPISKFWDHLNISQTEKATIFKFGTHGRGHIVAAT